MRVGRLGGRRCELAGWGGEGANREAGGASGRRLPLQKRVGEVRWNGGNALFFGARAWSGEREAKRLAVARESKFPGVLCCTAVHLD